MYLDTLNSLVHEFPDRSPDTLMVLGAVDFCNLYDYHEFARGYSRVILYNQEPVACASDGNISECRPGWIAPGTKYYEWLSAADEVWDYDEENVQLLREIGIDAKLHILAPYMNWSIYAPVEKDIDILFVGRTDNLQRRNVLLDFLGRKYNVTILRPDNPIYGDSLDHYILRSRILLNIHGASPLQEQARMVKWIGAPCQIVSEKSIRNYLNVPEKEYWELFLL
jgi:hypothetical protein